MSTRLVSWNVNGLRAIGRNGFLDWFAATCPDIVCIQETRARPEQVDEDLRHPGGFFSYWHLAEKPGYSGVTLFSRHAPLAVRNGIGIPEIDREGRVQIAEYPEFMLVNAYFPHARRDLSRLDFKLFFLDAFDAWLERQNCGKPFIICGDYNISHHEIDLANPRANRKNAGFLPQERAWMDRLLANGFSDIFRERYPDRNGYYTWWSNRRGVRERNVGWRIDYHCISRALTDRVIDVGHESGVRGSDHCPIYLCLDDGDNEQEQNSKRF